VELPESSDHAARRCIVAAVASRGLRTAADELRRYMKGEPLKNVVQAAI